ncbi:hypothetical protein HDU67_009658 [Dinochytrium kinnereticum]|nr:hypothetical protein HDU67_009658 [Dinochytrium kinnereticum]
MHHLLAFIHTRTDLISLSKVSRPWRTFCNRHFYTTLRPTSGSQLVALASSLHRSKQLYSAIKRPGEKKRKALDSPMEFIRTLDFSGLRGFKSKVTDQMFVRLMDSMCPDDGDGLPRARLERVVLGDCYRLSNESVWVLLRRHGGSLLSLDISFCNLVTLNPSYVPPPRPSPPSPTSSYLKKPTPYERPSRTDLNQRDLPTLKALWPPPNLCDVTLTLGTISSWAVSTLLSSNALTSLRVTVMSDTDPWDQILPLTNQPTPHLHLLSLLQTRVTDPQLSLLFTLFAEGGGLRSLEVRGEKHVSGGAILRGLRGRGMLLTTLDLRCCSRVSVADLTAIITETCSTLKTLAMGPTFSSPHSSLTCILQTFHHLSLARALENILIVGTVSPCDEGEKVCDEIERIDEELEGLVMRGRLRMLAVMIDGLTHQDRDDFAWVPRMGRPGTLSSMITTIPDSTPPSTQPHPSLTSLTLTHLPTWFPHLSSSSHPPQTKLPPLPSLLPLTHLTLHAFTPLQIPSLTHLTPHLKSLTHLTLHLHPSSNASVFQVSRDVVGGDDDVEERGGGWRRGSGVVNWCGARVWVRVLVGREGGAGVELEEVFGVAMA